MDERKRKVYIDYLKMIAAILVVAQHCVAYYMGNATKGMNIAAIVDKAAR